MYGKIYEQTFTGSMYGSGSCIFAVWSYVIAHTKPDAMVELNPVALASTIGESVAEIEKAIEHFKSPDLNSRSKEFEGRRLIQKGQFIYFVPQYHKYHGFANNKERREYFAQKKREQRQRDRECQTVKSNESKNVKQSDAVLSTQKTQTEEIYCAYPKKVGKPEGIKAISRALEKLPFNELLTKTKAFAAVRNGDTAFCPNPATWFNQERYNDDPSTWSRCAEPGRVVRSMSTFEIEKKIKYISDEISKKFKLNGGRVENDGIDELKQRRDELQKQLLV